MMKYKTNDIILLKHVITRNKILMQVGSPQYEDELSACSHGDTSIYKLKPFELKTNYFHELHDGESILFMYHLRGYYTVAKSDFTHSDITKALYGSYRDPHVIELKQKILDWTKKY